VLILSHLLVVVDEPTNHLHETAVKWLEDYLNNLSHQTVVCVSHDVDFLDNICTDVIHYEKRGNWAYNKLVHYKGNMTDFAKQPASKNYFRELAKEKGPLGNLNMEDDGMMKFVFPEPGRLDGIKTSTQKFIEMENVDFRYPGADQNQLTNINLKMSLSSRIVVLGANGAGT
jgi:elongation factor 3